MYELGRKSHYGKEAERLESECLNNDGGERIGRTKNQKLGDKEANGEQKMSDRETHFPTRYWSKSSLIIIIDDCGKIDRFIESWNTEKLH